MNIDSEYNPMQLIDAKKLAELLAVSTRTIWRMHSQGKITRPVRVGGSVRWRLAEVQHWIDLGCPQPESDAGLKGQRDDFRGE